MKTKTLSKVRIEDFDIRLLRQAAREGRLFVQPSDISETEKRQQAFAEILTYVSRINDCASPVFADRMTAIWQAILSNETLRPLFLLSRYASTRNQPNWYRVTAVVLALHENGIYRRDLTVLDLHLRLEQTTHRNNRYNGMNRYLLERPDLKVLNDILNSFRNNSQQ